MKTAFALLITSLSICGCATSRPIQGPNGVTAYFIKCAANAIDTCYEEAAKVCPTGYTFLNQQGSNTATIIPMGKSFMVAGGPNTMMVECKQ